MSRYEKSSVVITSNRMVDDWGKLLGDVVVVAPLLDRIMRIPREREHSFHGMVNTDSTAT
jgi:DNA replication protein DnaC